MPSEVLCVRCGKAVDATVAIHLGHTVNMLCPACVGWQRVHGSDQEDHEDTTGLGIRRPASRPNDLARRL